MGLSFMLITIINKIYFHAIEGVNEKLQFFVHRHLEIDFSVLKELCHIPLISYENYNVMLCFVIVIY